MDARDPALARLRFGLLSLADCADAHCSALFVPRQSGLHLVAQNEIDQQALDVTHSAWVRRHDELAAGAVLRHGTAVVWPLFDGPNPAALIYLDQAPAAFPDEAALEYAQDLVLRLRRLAPPSTVSNYMAAGLSLAEARLETDRDHVAIALRVSQGKVRAAARLLGITRETFYKRAHRLGIDIDAFRLRR